MDEEEGLQIKEMWATTQHRAEGGHSWTLVQINKLLKFIFLITYDRIGNLNTGYFHRDTRKILILLGYDNDIMAVLKE